MRNRLRLNLPHVILLSALLFFAGIVCHIHDLNAGSQNTSGKTVDDLIEISRDLLHESGTSEMWTDAELQRYLYVGMRDIIAKTHCLEEVESHVLDSSVTEYAVSNPYTTIRNVLWQFDSGATKFKALQRTQINSVGNLSRDVDEPKFFYEYGAKVGVVPVTNEVSGTTVQVLYIPRQADLSGGSAAFPLPATLDEAAIYYVVSHAYLKDRRWDAAAYFRSLYQTELQHFRQDFIYQPPEPLGEAVQ